jgi:hypothetical protein
VEPQIKQKQKIRKCNKPLCKVGWLWAAEGIEIGDFTFCFPVTRINKGKKQK